MAKVGFELSGHFHRNEDFARVVDNAVTFFKGTPVHTLPPPEKFPGTGVYALYYTGAHSLYKRYAKLNKNAFDFPIYVGKAVPRGWRQARVSDDSGRPSYELYSRLREHSGTINHSDLAIGDFRSRFIVFDITGAPMIGTLEAKLINIFKPLWNTVLDGFGNHTPGEGRFEQAKSDWDVIHPGRSWANRCKGQANDKDEIQNRVKRFLEALKE